jgi:hypothetical protein
MNTCLISYQLYKLIFVWVSYVGDNFSEGNYHRGGFTWRNIRIQKIKVTSSKKN